MLPCTIDSKVILQEKIDPLAWLNSQPLYPKVFWKEKHDPTIRAAVGATLLFPRVPILSPNTDPDIRLYGGMRFNAKELKNSVWQQFPSTAFWLPQIEMTCKEDSTQIQSYQAGGELFPEGYAKEQPTLSCLSRLDTPCFSDWKQLIETTLNAVRLQQIDKLVLARQTTVQLSHPLSPWALISELLSRPTQSTLFAFQLTPSLCFLGATPEMLFKREGMILTTDAIAGTRQKGVTLEEEKQLEQELLGSEKDRREFGFVKKSLETILLPLAKKGGWDGADRILKTAHLQHLYNRLNIELKTPLSDAELIALLHPTPALGGYPREAALPLLKQLEPFDRGWYGAPIGIISSEKSAFYAAIRSALVKEREIHLFAGLGVVEGSCPQKEWEELNAKISWFKGLPLL